VIYQDYNNEWFNQVGIKMMIAMIGYILTPHFVQLFLLPLNRCVRRCSARCKLFQIDMNKSYAGPELDITFVYSSSMNQIFIACFYFSGIPGMVWIAFLSLTGCYFI
jgi:hypothetical protein